MKKAAIAITVGLLFVLVVAIAFKYINWWWVAAFVLVFASGFWIGKKSNKQQS